MILIVSDGAHVVTAEPMIQVGAAAQDAVVYKFNPSNVGRVQQVKLLSAAVLQLLNDEEHDRAKSGLHSNWTWLRSQACAMIITACMWAVRVVTDGR